LDKSGKIKASTDEYFLAEHERGGIFFIFTIGKKKKKANKKTESEESEQKFDNHDTSHRSKS
jgi:hypothetical protein